MSKINSKELLHLIDTNIPRKDIADRFQCSQAAISKRLARLRPKTMEAHEPLKIDSLTPKERAFAIAIASGETQTNAAIKAYDVTTRDSAKSLGCTLMNTHQGIREAIEELREREIPLKHLMKRLRQHVDCPDPTASLRAVDMGLKLHNAYPASKNLNINANVDVHPVDLSLFLNTQSGVDVMDNIDVD